MKKEIEIGCLVRIIEDFHRYHYKGDRWGIVVMDEGEDEETRTDTWGRWTVVTPEGDYIPCTSAELELMEEVEDGVNRTTTVSQVD